MKPRRLLLLAYLVSLLPASVVESAPMAATDSPAAKADQSAVVDGNNAFAVNLYDKLKDQSGNLFFSPESISTALAMTYAGARGATASEMAQTLHFTLPPERMQPAMGALLSDLNAAHIGYQLCVANALWAQQDYRFLDDFLNVMKSNYGAGFNEVNFKGATEAARSTINAWVEQHTQGKITNLLQPGSVRPATRLVLTNAIYFKGDWQTQFDKTQTKLEDFHLTQTETVKASLMHREGGFTYFKGETFQVLEIPYRSNELSMIVFLPNDVGGLSALEEALTASNTQQWLQQLRFAPKVILSMPKFKMTEEFELAGTLGDMGMPQAFQLGVADFSGMTGNRDFAISAVIHKAYIDVNEEGTEAAAATAVTMRTAMARAPDRTLPIVFRADHPFILMIRDTRSGGFLFMGRVAHPASEN